MIKKKTNKRGVYFTTNIEQWDVDGRKIGLQGRVIVEKVAVRDAAGRFHSATNFRGTVPAV